MISLMITAIFLFFTHGELWAQIFFPDVVDTGMDFFHSIEYTNGRAPYDLWGTLYPPLANLFFYFIYRFVPFYQIENWNAIVWTRGTESDLRVHQATLMLFIAFIVSLVVLLVYCVERYLENTELSIAVAISSLVTYGFLYAVERGNIILLAMLLSAIFVWFRESENKVISELALIALAIAAGLKIYPALLGMLLIYSKQYKKALRTVLYGLIAFVLPCFCFHEGLRCIKEFFEILQKFSVTENINTLGFSFDKICNTVCLAICSLFELEIPTSFLLDVITKFNILIVVLLVVAGFFLKENWKKVLCCCMSILMYQTQGIYLLSILIIPLIVMIKEEKYIRKSNILYFILLVSTQCLLPIVGFNGLISINYLRLQIPLLIILIMLCIDAIKCVIQRKECCISDCITYL